MARHEHSRSVFDEQGTINGRCASSEMRDELQDNSWSEIVSAPGKDDHYDRIRPIYADFSGFS
jgi:hypothetical protein